MNDVIDYNKNGVIVAPAGHGKTENIIVQIKSKNIKKKILILTHTNIGVQEINDRAKKNNISINKISIYTIASFALKYIQAFPILSGYDKDKELFENDIYNQMVTLLKNKHIKEIITNTYGEIYIDEYQDCSINQHKLIKELCGILNYKIYGDPLQSLYDFNEPPVAFDEILRNDYELIGRLNYPWRWDKANKELGKWILKIRERLENNKEITLCNVPNTVNFIKTNNIDESLRKVGYKYFQNKFSNVILTSLPYQAKKYVKIFSGKYKMQEEIECKDLKKMIKLLDEKNKEELLIELFNILKSAYTKMNVYNNIIEKVKRRSFDFRRLKNNRELAYLITKFINENNLYDNIISIIEFVEKQRKMNLCRMDLIILLKKILNNLKLNNEKSAVENFMVLTANRRQKKYHFLVSRVLLVKGLQFENVVIVEPENMTKKEFYVAISRATNSLTIISKNDSIKYDN